MHKLLAILSCTLLLLLLSTNVAKADSGPTVTFTGGYSTDPNSNYGIGPYTGLLGTQPELFYCLDFSHDISKGDNWTVSITNLLPSSDFTHTRLGAGSEATYQAMAWLVTQLMSSPSGSVQAAEDQWAIWNLSASSVPVPTVYAGAVSSLDHQALAAGFTAPNGWEILTPTGSNGQEFLVVTPEPSTWLYGIGSLLFILVFKQRALLR